MIDLYLAFQGTVCLRSYVLGGFVDRVLVGVYDIELEGLALGPGQVTLMFSQHFTASP